MSERVANKPWYEKALDERAEQVAAYQNELAALAASHARLLECCKAIQFANGLFEHANHVHDPDTEWEKAWELCDAAMAEAERLVSQ